MGLVTGQDRDSMEKSTDLGGFLLIFNTLTDFVLASEPECCLQWSHEVMSTSFINTCLSTNRLYQSLLFRMPNSSTSFTLIYIQNTYIYISKC